MFPHQRRIAPDSRDDTEHHVRPRRVRGHQLPRIGRNPLQHHLIQLRRPRDLSRLIDQFATLPGRHRSTRHTRRPSIALLPRAYHAAASSLWGLSETAARADPLACARSYMSHRALPRRQGEVPRSVPSDWPNVTNPVSGNLRRERAEGPGRPSTYHAAASRPGIGASPSVFPRHRDPRPARRSAHREVPDGEGHAAGGNRWKPLSSRWPVDVGLRASSVELALATTPYPIALVKRFDRVGGRRVHYVSARTFLGFAGNESAYYPDLADAMRAHCGSGADRRNELRELRRIMFSILISNDDDHLKNHGFLYEGDGAWRLSPAFDINPNPDGSMHLQTGTRRSD